MTAVITREDDLRPYDLVRISRVGRFDNTGVAVFYAENQQTELLHRPKPKPPVGTVLTGKQVRSRPWKRGTTLICTQDAESELNAKAGFSFELKLFELTEHGTWAIRNGPASSALQLSMQDIQDGDVFVLIRRPQEESDAA